MTQETNPNPIDLGLHHTLIATRVRGYWGRMLSSPAERAPEVLVIVLGPTDPARWVSSFPEAARVVLHDLTQPLSVKERPFDIVIDAASGPTSTEAVANFNSCFDAVSAGGCFFFTDKYRQGFLSALESGSGEMIMSQVHTIVFELGLCIVRKRGDGESRKRAFAATVTPTRSTNSALESYQQSTQIVKLRAEAKQEAAAARRAADAEAAKVAEIHASTSWRVTRPLRWVGTQVLRARGAVRLFRLMQDRHQGTMGALMHGINKMRRVGVSGLSLAAAQATSQPEDYAEWVRRYDTLDAAGRDALAVLIDAMPHKPLISVLMPAYNPNLDWLTKAVASVQAQIYPHWEFCIADDASPDAACRDALARYAAEDSRIKVVYRKQNGHISAASNSALTLVTGEWTALMDQDDLLPAHALAWVAHAINMYPQARLIYSDEDKVNEADERFDPYFKPDWNVDLLRSQNMFSHLGVFHTALLHEVGGFQEGMEGAQDHDLVLRCIERISANQIHHIPKVLYHWRVHAESTASSTDAKPYAQIAGENALNAHLRRTGASGRVEALGHGYRVHYDLPHRPPLVSLIIPTRNAVSLVRQCVDSIVALTTYPNYEVILVDNGSDEAESLSYFKALSLRPGFKVLRDDGEFNYSALNNEAVAQASGEIVALINNDIEVISPEWLAEMVSIAMQPGVGAVGAKLWYPNDTLQHGGVVLGVGGVANHSHKNLPRGRRGYFGRADLIQSFSAVTAACLVVRKDRYEAVGGLDETNLKVAFNDVDFCLRLRELGLRNVWTPYAELYHHESATRGEDVDPEKRARFVAEVDYMMQRWGDELVRDPAYNPNLTILHEDFGLAWPPRSFDASTGIGAVV